MRNADIAKIGVHTIGNILLAAQQHPAGQPGLLLWQQFKQRLGHGLPRAQGIIIQRAFPRFLHPHPFILVQKGVNIQPLRLRIAAGGETLAVLRQIEGNRRVDLIVNIRAQGVGGGHPQLKILRRPLQVNAPYLQLIIIFAIGFIGQLAHHALYLGALAIQGLHRPHAQLHAQNIRREKHHGGNTGHQHRLIPAKTRAENAHR